MGKSTQYRNWAVTFNTGSGYTIKESDIDGFGIEHLGINFVMYVGPQESSDYDNADYHSNATTHQHLLVHSKETSVSRTKVRQVLQVYSELSKEQIRIGITYLRRVEGNKDIYKRYCFKASNYNLTPYMRYDYLVYTKVEEKKITSVPTYEEIKTELINGNGVELFNRKLKAILQCYNLAGDQDSALPVQYMIDDTKMEEPFDYLYADEAVAISAPRPIVQVAPFPETMLTPRQLFNRERDRMHLSEDLYTPAEIAARPYVRGTMYHAAEVEAVSDFDNEM